MGFLENSAFYAIIKVNLTYAASWLIHDGRLNFVINEGQSYTVKVVPPRDSNGSYVTLIS
ncbi:MAG: hypothetical protein RMK18_10020 [Armatimonadota bacterium]|nr:hypothetical protein [Armatimonadota bacterium]